MSTTYLDHNASAPLGAAGRARMVETLDAAWANPASLHGPGVAARQALERARREVAALIGARPSEVVFTSGGTEANVTALRAMALRHGAARPARVAVCATEHPAALRPLDQLAGRGLAEVCPVGVDRAGRVDLDDLASRLRDADGLCLMAANNETGVIADLVAVARLARSAGVPWHCDAVQAAPWLDVDVHGAGPWSAVQTLALSAHKLGGPPGVGALFVRGGTELEPLLTGGGQEGGRRGGTPPVPLCAGFGAAAAAVGSRDVRRVATLRDRARSSLLAARPGSVAHGDPAARLPNTLSIALRDAEGGWEDGEWLVLELAERGVAVSSGAACASGSGDPSHVLLAMGCSPSEAQATLRISLGPETADQDIDRLLEVLT